MKNATRFDQETDFQKLFYLQNLLLPRLSEPHL